MKTSRRDFLKITGAAIVAGTVGTLAGSEAHAGAGLGAGVKAVPGEMPKNMTFLTISKNGEYSLGVKTEKGILDVRAASRAFKKKVPTTIDDVLLFGDRGLTALTRRQSTTVKRQACFWTKAQSSSAPV